MITSRLAYVLTLAASFSWAGPPAKELLDALWAGDIARAKRIIAAGSPVAMALIVATDENSRM